MTALSLYCPHLAESDQFPAWQLKETAVSQLRFSSTDGGPALRLWTPGAEPEQDPPSPREHRMVYPVLPPASLFEQLAEQTKSGPQHVPSSQLARIRGELTLREFYREWVSTYRKQQKSTGEVSEGTLSKERQALNRWEKWELSACPDDWPIGTPWRGVPIGYIRGGWVDRFFAAMQAKYAPDTVKSTRNHLYAVFNFAVKVGAIEQAPQAKPLDLEDPDDLDEDLATVWTEAEINRLYQAMEGHHDLQAALVLGCNCGPRSVDLFGATWDRNMRFTESPPRYRFRAKKTKKKHGIPLHPVVIAHLDRLKREHLFDPGGLVFPRLTSLTCADPERSKAARRRNRLIKSFMRQAGVPEYNKPWQVCRATCCTRLNNVRLDGIQGGVGSWCIGQGSERSRTKLAENYYDNPTEAVIKTIMSAPQPAAFQSIFNRTPSPS